MIHLYKIHKMKKVQTWKTDQQVPRFEDGVKGEDITTKKQPQECLCGNGNILYLVRGSDYMNLHRGNKMTWNYTYTLYHCQLPGFDITLSLYNMYPLGEVG